MVYLNVIFFASSCLQYAKVSYLDVLVQGFHIERDWSVSALSLQKTMTSYVFFNTCYKKSSTTCASRL